MPSLGSISALPVSTYRIVGEDEVATIQHVFEPFDGVAPATNFATIDVPVGTNFPVPCLDFDGGSTDESMIFLFRAIGYGAGTWLVEIDWYADTASSGNVRWGVEIAAITPETDTQDIETKGFDTKRFVTDSHLGTTAQRLHRASLTIAVDDLDAVAKDDYVILRLSRAASDTELDTMTGDACMVRLTVSYST